MKNLYDIWFSNVDIKNETKLNLLEKFDTKEIWEMDLACLVNCRVAEEEIVKLKKCKNLEEYQKHSDCMDLQNIKLFSIKDEAYPHKLKVIENSPAFLYVRGNEDILDEDAVRNCWL